MALERPAVVVTGSSGLVGSPVCLALAERGYYVFGFDRIGPPEPPEHPHVRDVVFDLSKVESVRSALAEVKESGVERLASVVHLAAYYDFSGEDSPLYNEVTVEGTRRLLQELRTFEVEQFLFSSSMLVHEPCKVGDYIDESSPLLAKWPYPASKIATEELICTQYPEVRSVLLRIAGVYTDWGTQPTLVQQIKRIYEKEFESRFFPGNQQAGQSSVHLEDTVEAIAKAVDARESIPPQTPILIGEPDPPSYERLQDTIGQLLHGTEWTTIYVPTALAKVGASVMESLSGGESFIKPFMVDMADDHYALDIRRAQQLLGWQPTRLLEDELPGIVERLKEDPERWYRENGLTENEG